MDFPLNVQTWLVCAQRRDALTLPPINTEKHKVKKKKVARIKEETFPPPLCGGIKSTGPVCSAGNPINIITAFFINERGDKVTHIPSRAAALSSQDNQDYF